MIRLATEADKKMLYHAFDLQYRLHYPLIVALRDTHIIGFISSSYSNGLLICGPGQVNLPPKQTGRTWIKMLALYDGVAKASGYGGYLVYVDNTSTLRHWNRLVARIPIFTIIGEEAGKFWYKRVFNDTVEADQWVAATTFKHLK